jgi:hypothetical protein
MVAEAFAGLSAIKSAFEIAKGLKDINDITRRNAAVIELQEKILSAQSKQADLVESIRELRARVAELQTWDTEKQRYDPRFLHHLLRAAAGRRPTTNQGATVGGR